MDMNNLPEIEKGKNFNWLKKSESIWDFGKDGKCEMSIKLSKDSEIEIEGLFSQFKGILYSLGFQESTIKVFFG
jgi:hypothetical protein